MVVFFIAFRWIHLSTPLIRLFLLVLRSLCLPTLNLLPVWLAVSLLYCIQLASLVTGVYQVGFVGAAISSPARVEFVVCISCLELSQGAATFTTGSDG